MKFKITYECADGNNQTCNFTGTQADAIAKAVEMTETGEGDSTMTWTVEDEDGETVASGTGNEIDE